MRFLHCSGANIHLNQCSFNLSVTRWNVFMIRIWMNGMEVCTQSLARNTTHTSIHMHHSRSISSRNNAGKSNLVEFLLFSQAQWPSWLLGFSLLLDSYRTTVTCTHCSLDLECACVRMTSGWEGCRRHHHHHHHHHHFVVISTRSGTKWLMTNARQM